MRGEITEASEGRDRQRQGQSEGMGRLSENIGRNTLHTLLCSQLLVEQNVRSAIREAEEKRQGLFARP